jgi:hypothetical protein
MDKKTSNLFFLLENQFNFIVDWKRGLIFEKQSEMVCVYDTDIYVVDNFKIKKDFAYDVRQYLKESEVA